MKSTKDMFGDHLWGMGQYFELGKRMGKMYVLQAKKYRIYFLATQSQQIFMNRLQVVAVLVTFI